MTLKKRLASIMAPYRIPPSKTQDLWIAARIFPFGAGLPASNIPLCAFAMASFSSAKSRLWIVDPDPLREKGLLALFAASGRFAAVHFTQELPPLRKLAEADILVLRCPKHTLAMGEA